MELWSTVSWMLYPSHSSASDITQLEEPEAVLVEELFVGFVLHVC
jgi:hypothetical protein